MTNLVSKFIPAFFIAMIFSFAGIGQTNISGTVLSNTIWTNSGSPYIINGIVVIPSGVTLKIDPGVTVKFANNAELQINGSFSSPYTGAHLIAWGTPTDSITFTSNSSAPVSGIWNRIRFSGTNDTALLFNYCTFKYAGIAIENGRGVLSISKIRNSSFYYNVTGIKDGYRLMEIDSCTFRYNNCALLNVESSRIGNCRISNNIIGFDDEWGNNGNLFKNCNIDSNQVGIKRAGKHLTIENCQVRYNQYGMILRHFDPTFPAYGSYTHISGSVISSNILAGLVLSTGGAIIDSCEFKFNGIAVLDSGGLASNLFRRNKIENNMLGIKLLNTHDEFVCNKICNNNQYNLKYLNPNPVNLSDNYWCTNNLSTLQASIFDGNDSTGLGLVNISPLDNVSCYTCPTILIQYTTTVSSQNVQNGTATLYPGNGTPPYNYLWNSSPSQTLQTAIGLGPGTYTVLVTDAAGCWTRVSVSIIDSAALLATGIKEFSDNSSALIFPNPVSDHLSLHIPAGIVTAEVKIYSIMGTLKYSNPSALDKYEIDVSDLPNGIYFMEFSINNKAIRRKFIKSK